MEAIAGASFVNLRARYDLIVVGAGPAGCAAAITAAHSGASVLLLERGRYPRHKVCGEFLSAESLAVLESLLGNEAELLVANAPRITHANLFKENARVSIPIDPPAISLARYDLDSALFQAAIKFGIEALQQTTATSITRDRIGFAVETSAGPFKARSLVVAAGRWSNLKHANITGSERPKFLGLKAHYQDSGKFPNNVVELHFFDAGYCGIDRITKDVVSVCALVDASAASNLAQIWPLTKALSYRANDWVPMFQPVSTFPVTFGDPIPECDGVLYAGDAAAFVDPFIGDGISLALQSGTLAAQCLTPVWRDESDVAEAATVYRAKYETRFIRVFRNAARIRRLLDLPDAVLRGVAQLLRMPIISRQLIRLTRAA